MTGSGSISGVGILQITVMWYYAVGAVVLGIFVAYAAMFGLDKFTALWAKLKDYKSGQGK